MSKVDAQRAMREAKYLRNRASGATRSEEAAASGTAAAPPARTPAARTPSAKPTRAAKSESAESGKAAPAVGELCGHRSMNGRACTRESGHAEKNHRYG
ncbi:MAG TPA: hypothetical protein VGC37_20105 [Friedmanniella sp.]